MDPHAEVPTDHQGRPDDRFDGTDSGPDGWDTPYPPVDPDVAPEDPGPGGPPSDEASRGPAMRAPGVSDEDPHAITERRPTRAAGGTTYDVDGPDEPAGAPQR